MPEAVSVGVGVVSTFIIRSDHTRSLSVTDNTQCNVHCRNFLLSMKSQKSLSLCVFLLHIYIAVHVSCACFCFMLLSENELSHCLCLLSLLLFYKCMYCLNTFLVISLLYDSSGLECTTCMNTNRLNKIYWE